MTKEDAAAILWGVQAHTAAGNSIEYSDKLQSAMALAINALNAPNTLETLETLKRVSKAYEQCAWERDIAIGQLRELGYGLGEKIRTDSDTISRQAAIDHWRLIIDATNTDSGYNMGFVDGLEFCISHLSTMPSAQPEITEEQAIEHLQSTGWMQRHDRILTESTWDIIRCRDCKYWREHKYAKETKRYIPFCGFNAIYTKADDFCSRAERKENR